MEGTPKAIEIKGITRNATKIGVQDGQAEDLINLRFMDGSWRASGDGRLIDFTTYMEYTQLYVHTNVYHHLLGVHEDPTTNVRTLYWFAEIGNDGVTFYPLDGSSRTSWPANMQDLPTAPVALTTVVGDIWITQTGHLLTVIDEADDFEHLVFKTDNNVYANITIDANGKSSDRKLYPFGGGVHFNLHSPWRHNNLETFDHAILVETESVPTDHDTNYYWVKPEIPIENAKEAFGRAQKKNLFINPFLACAAFRLYDGSYAYASNPVLIYPRQTSSSGVRYYDKDEADYRTFDLTDSRTQVGVGYQVNPTLWTGRKYYHRIYELRNEGQPTEWNYDYPTNSIPVWSDSLVDDLPSFMAGIAGAAGNGSSVTWLTMLLGSDLVCNVTDEMRQIMIANKDVISAFCIFVTPEINLYDLDENLAIPFKRQESGWLNSCLCDTIFFKRKKNKEIINQLVNQPFFLLKEYTDIDGLLEDPIVDLSDKPEYLYNLTQQTQTLQTESLSRTTYLPKVSYMYNGRLHIANYKSYSFFGYPIDLFHLHNHSVKVQDGAWFPADEAGKRVLPNLADNNDAYQQFPKTSHNFPSGTSGLQYFAYIQVTIDSSQGEQKVVRYIQPYDTTTAENGRADFIEDLNPLITYPDARAKHIKIVRYDASLASSCTFEFDMKPHPYLNMAYYIDPDLKPISLTGSGIAPAEPEPLPEMQNMEEYFPNGLKVSKTDQPMFFPVENTYQVGSAEILALMSNTIAVGTGQTGDAPLYVFCKDGVYALYVDSSGQMAYPNARILARDVCNNPRSVTPIDAGVVFTTDRGLMMIAGEQVEEIGQPAEGDVLKFADTTSGNKEFIKIANGALRKIADLPNMVTATDFLTYLTGAIINYNHNMRELMVSNPAYQYSYIMDRERNWSRRDYTAAEYVNNYPTSYRVVNIGTAVNPNIKFYRVDDEGDALSSLEQRKEADNHIFYLSNVIKLDSIGFKQAYRFVVRGYFETQVLPAFYGRFNDRDVYFVSEEFAAYSVGSTLTLDNFSYSADYIRFHHGSTSSDLPYIKYARIYDKATLRDITTEMATGYITGVIYSPLPTIPLTRGTMPTLVGCYVFGSYDGRKWALLGGKEKTGKFTDIGCKVERTDVKFFRICLAGQVTGKTRIDYMELSATSSVLNTKIR